MTIVDSYSEDNRSGSGMVYADQPGEGQSFTGDGGVLAASKFFCKKTGLPTGSAYSKIYAHSGTFGTSSVPTGSPLATSDAFNVATLTGDYQLITFTFSGAEKITLTNTTKYVVTFEYTGGTYENYVDVGDDWSSPGHGGNRSYVQTGTWTASSSTDSCFYVYKDDLTTTSTTTTTTTSTSTTTTTTSTTVSVTTSTSTTSTTTSTSITTTTTSTTTTTTSTTTTLPIFPLPFSGIKISKPGINVLQTNDPRNLIFSSRYPNLKYFKKGSMRISFDAGAGDISATGIYQHNLGYYPFIEAFSSVYLSGAPTGIYEYCPFFGSGATIAYSTNYRITKTTVQFYGQISGMSADVWVFDFIFFIFKNNLGF